MIPPTWDSRFVLIETGIERERAQFVRDVAVGLSSVPKRLSCRYFYDEEGSRLFEAICALDEYYLPRAEREILQRRAPAIAGAVAAGAVLVELGSGSAIKTRLLIEALLRRQPTLRYVPIDVSRSALEGSSQALLADYPGLEIVAVAGEYLDGFEQLKAEADHPRLVLWLGSNIGNLGRAEAAGFLRRLGGLLSPADRLLCGIDLRKERAVLDRAYDDPRGITAAFNRNLLARINRELGGHFDLESFRHRAFYNEDAGRVEMYLVSTRGQLVAVDAIGLQFSFTEGEAIHTEDSYKYSLQEIQGVAAAAGLRLERHWLDSGCRFSANLLALGEPARPSD
jgi:L-histidine Nalpha-methyltransferase